MKNIAKVLVIDDMNDSCIHIKSTLDPEIYEVLVCDNEDSVLDILKEESIDLVIIDYELLKIDSKLTVKKINQTHSQLPILFCLYDESSKSIDLAYQAGANDFVIKPFKRIEVLRRVENLVNVYRSKKKLKKQLKIFKSFVPDIFLDTERRLKLDTHHAFDIGLSKEDTYSALFMGILEFDHLSDQMKSKEVFNFLNSYFRQMGPIISQYGGFIYQYMGVGILALFPLTKKGTSDNALHAAISLSDKIKLYNRGRQRAGYSTLKSFIGINTGNIALGIAGTSEQMAAGAFGNTINLAARCQSMSKDLDADIILSENTLNLLHNPDACLYRYLGKEKIKGYEELVRLYEVYSSNSPEQRDKKQQTSHRWNDLLNQYETNPNLSQDQIRSIIDQLIAENPQDLIPQKFKNDKLKSK